MAPEHENGTVQLETDSEREARISAMQESVGADSQPSDVRTTGSIEQRVRDEWEKQSANLPVDDRAFEMMDAGNLFGFGIRTCLRLAVGVPVSSLGLDPTDAQITELVRKAIAGLEDLERHRLPRR